ncbi:MAG TPA: MFS transporter [Rhabdochlamydiaceae bacterium]|nr:MFS transporter [Rhabdochlamydiaceae bacterium]
MIKKPFFHFRFSTIQRFLSKLPGFSRPDQHSLGFLNASQFLGILNENIYKLVLVFFLIDIEGVGKANNILALTGVVFVTPFILFSSLAGVLADRFSKSRLIMLTKLAEIVIMSLVLFAFAFQSRAAGYCLLFLLTTQEALFGPSKYGIIPELVPRPMVSKANGLITSFTYLAIIIGTFLASFMTEITNRHYVIVGAFCLLLAIIGFLATFGIRYIPPKGIKKRINPFFLQEIYQTLKICKEKKHLIVAMSGSAFFLFIGAFTQLNIIPFAIQSLHFSEIAGGYLFLATALGIVCGAFVAGRVSKKNIELGLSCFSGFLIALALFLLGVLSAHLIAVIILLFFLGFFGGTFIIPFDSYIQVFSPEEHRGHAIGATNFLSFCGVLVASFALYFFNEMLGLTSAKSFFMMGIITLGYSLFIFFRLSDFSLNYISKRVLRPLFKLELMDINLVYKAPYPLLILQNATWLKACLLSSLFPNIFFLIPEKNNHFFLKLFYSIHIIPLKQINEIAKNEKFQVPEETLPCIYLKKGITIDSFPPPVFLSQLFKVDVHDFIYVKFEELKFRSAVIKFSKTKR